jgi:hypothetical protein
MGGWLEVNHWFQSRLPAIGTVLIYFLDWELEVLHKSKELPNTGSDPGWALLWNISYMIHVHFRFGMWSLDEWWNAQIWTEIINFEYSKANSTVHQLASWQRFPWILDLPDSNNFYDEHWTCCQLACSKPRVGLNAGHMGCFNAMTHCVMPVTTAWRLLGKPAWETRTKPFWCLI